MGMFIVLLCPVGIALALVRRCARAGPAGPAVRGDVPERLLRWAAGLLSARREEWGQAMVGELDHIDGRGRRWRFAGGCAGAAVRAEIAGDLAGRGFAGIGQKRIQPWTLASGAT